MTRTSSFCASIVLSPHELKHYRRYLRQTQTHGCPSKINSLPLPCAIAFADFQVWRQKRDSGYFSDASLCNLVSAPIQDQQKGKNGIAIVCKHVLHPAHYGRAEEVVERCPVCLVECHLEYMSALTHALESAGILVRQRWEPASHEPTLRAYHTGKLACTRELARLEDLASQEHYWATRNPRICVGDARTASEALDMYWARTDTSVSSSSAFIESMSSQGKQGQEEERSKCTVSFVHDTRFERGRDAHYFWRKSPRYEAGGKYSAGACDDDSATKHDIDAYPRERFKSVNGERHPCLTGSNNELNDESTEDEGETGQKEETDLIFDDGDSDSDSDRGEMGSDSSSSASDCDYVISVEVEEETSFIVFVD